MEISLMLAIALWLLAGVAGVGMFRLFINPVEWEKFRTRPTTIPIMILLGPVMLVIALILFFLAMANSEML